LFLAQAEGAQAKEYIDKSELTKELLKKTM
jgi:hypothetical protein